MAMDMRRYENVLRKQTGKAVRPARFDGYVNLINRYGTAKDDTEQYFFKPEPIVDDVTLEMFYENNGLFARIIDTPAEEAVKHGFTIDGISDDEITDFYTAAMDELDWEEVAMTALKWARLFGGSIAVMLINDGRGLEEPVDWKHIRSIDDIVVFDRSMIMPDRTSLYQYDPEDPFRTRGSRLGTPEWYEITGPNGNFVVHDSRCLTFRNGVLPLNAQNENYQIWGIPEYVRISRAVRNAEIAHESAPKMLSKSVQPVYKMKDLAMELATEEGEDKVLRRLQAIDMARGLLNSITIDAEGEDYSFQSFGFNGVSDVIESSCNWLSALTNIPQTILFGRSPAGMNATGHSDFENYYNYVERIQKRMLRSNLRYLLSIIFTAGKHTGEIKEIPDIDVQFNPLWSMNEEEETQLETAKLQNELTRANIAQTYIGMEVLDPKEVRVELGKDDPMDPETMLDEMSEEELLESAPQGQPGAEGGEGGMPGMGGGAPQMPPQGGEAEAAPAPAPAQDEAEAYYATTGNSPETAPEATKLPQDMNPEEEPDHEDAEGEDLDWITMNGTHIPLDENGTAVGGPVAGKTFSNAKSAKKGESGEEKSGESAPVSGGSSAGAPKREAVQGKDILASYDGPKDIKSVIHAQGFDGLPRVVSQEEFDKAVKASNFIAQRTYSASSQEILDEYQNQLYNGDWYIECSEGGAINGQGMYSASDYTGTLSDGIKAEMESYKKVGESRFSASEHPVSAVETFTLDPDARTIDHKDIAELKAKEKEDLTNKYMTGAIRDSLSSVGLGDNEDAMTWMRAEAGMDVGWSAVSAAMGRLSDEDRAKINTVFAQTKQAAWDARDKASTEHFHKFFGLDDGAYAALLGYDAIKAPGHEPGTTYTTVLNRSKCIFLNAAKRTDAMDEGKITFKLGEDGKIDAIRNGEVIGWVIAQEGNGEAGRGDDENDFLEPGGLIKRWSAPEYQPPYFDPEASGNWLVKDTDAIMSFIPDDDTNSPEWLDDEIKRRIRAVGVLVVDQHGKILSGIRKGGTGENYGLLGGPGGHVEPHESLEDAAIRETYEEFGIVAKDLMFLTLGDYEEESGMIPAIFLCTEWAGSVHPVDGEMENIRFRTIDDIETHKLFGPFESSLEILEKELTSEDEDGNMAIAETDRRFDGNRGNLARATIAKAISEGFDDKKDENKNDTLNKAIEYLEKEKGITQQDVLDEWKANRKASKEHQRQKAAQKNAEQTARANKHKQEAADVVQAKQEANTLFPVWAATYSNKWQAAQSTHAPLPKGEVFRRAFGKISLSKTNPFPLLATKYNKHVVVGKEAAFAGMSMAQFNTYACDLAQTRVGGKIKGFTRNDGDILRYDADKNVLVIVDGNGMFVKSCHELSRTNYPGLISGGIKGQAYYEFQKRVFGWR